MREPPPDRKKVNRVEQYFRAGTSGGFSLEISSMFSRIRISGAICSFLLLVQLLNPFSASAKDLGWQPEKTWVFVVGVLNWKHGEMFGSFPVKNRRDAALVDFFKKSGVPEAQVVYLQDKQATQQRIHSAFAAELKKLRPHHLSHVYY